MQMLWWHWIVIGFALCLAELALPALVLVWLGISALALGLLLLVFPFSLTLQLFIWAASSAGLTYLWLVVFKRTPADSRAGSSGEIIGETGLLVKDAGPFLKGELIFQRPILGADRWQCIAETHLRAGARVKVVAVEGSVLKIEAS